MSASSRFRILTQSQWKNQKKKILSRKTDFKVLTGKKNKAKDLTLKKGE